MKLSQGTSKRRIKSTAAQIQLGVVRVFVTHYCANMPWKDVALGAVRARDYTRLLRLSKQVSNDLICSCSLDETHESTYRDAEAYALASQFVALIGKYQYPLGAIPGMDPEARAIQDFLMAERRNKRLNTLFRAHLKRGTERHWSIPLIRDVFCRVLGRTPPYEDIFNRCDFSGGASVGHSGELTHVAVKLCGETLTGSTRALDYFIEAVRNNQQYAETFMRWEDGFCCFDHREMEVRIRLAHEDVDYNMVIVVPKKADMGRTIGKEPEIHNFLQKGIDLVMRDLLVRMLGIDLSDQVANQELSLIGSTETYDPYVTIDVRDASRSMLTELVRSVCPPRWFRLFDATRSHCYKIDDAVVPYQMFCSMGNGFCFPLESLLFASICIAAARHMGVPPDYRVYGDDIIVRQSAALVVIEVLAACGFRTNVDKTFIHGPFRESCGANWYSGQDVTPGYLKEPITTHGGLHSLHNALHKYPLVQEYLRQQPIGDGYAVEDSPCWSWITDQAFKVPLDVAMRYSGTKFNRETRDFEFKILLGAPVSDESWVLADRLGAMPRDQMVYTAMLRGSLSNAPFHYRRRTSYKSVKTTKMSLTTRAPTNLREFYARELEYQDGEAYSVRLRKADMHNWRAGAPQLTAA